MSNLIIIIIIIECNSLFVYFYSNYFYKFVHKNRLTSINKTNLL